MMLFRKFITVRSLGIDSEKKYPLGSLERRLSIGLHFVKAEFRLTKPKTWFIDSMRASYQAYEYGKKVEFMEMYGGNKITALSVDKSK